MKTMVLSVSYYWNFRSFRKLLQWRHDGERDRVSIHRPLDCLFNRLFGGRSKKTPKLRVTGLCEENPTVTAEFPLQMTSDAKMFSFWCHHGRHSNLLSVIKTGAFAIWFCLNFSN